MSSNNNFLLKIHMEEDNSTKEIYLNKERRSFTFVNDECVSDLIIPEFKITSLNMILENVSEDKENTKWYAEYYKENETKREYDKEKIDLLVNMVTKININDFIDNQSKIKINDYYIDNIVDAYNCVLPIEIKRILSYTTNGVAFDSDDKLYMMPHEDIVEYSRQIKNFIPIIIRNENNYIGYDYNSSLLKEFNGDKLIREGKDLKELLSKDEEETSKEVDESENEGETDIDKKLAELSEKYETTVKNIDYQFERLINGINPKEEPTTPVTIDEKKLIEEEIRLGVRNSLEELEKTNNIIDEIDINIDKVAIKPNLKVKKEKDKNPKTKEIIKTPKIKEKANEQLENEKFIEFLKEYDKGNEKKNFEAEYNRENEEKIVQDFKEEYDKKEDNTKSKEVYEDFLKQYELEGQKENNQKLFQQFLKEYENKLRKNKKDEEFRKFLKEYDSRLKKEKEEKYIQKVLEEFNKLELKEKIEQRLDEVLKQYDKHEIKESDNFEELLKEYNENEEKTELQGYFNEFLQDYHQENKENNDDKSEEQTKKNTQLFQQFVKEYEEEYAKENENKLFNEFLIQYDRKKKKDKSNKMFQEFLKQYELEKQKEKKQKLFQEFLKQYENKLRKAKKDERFRQFLISYDKKIQKEKEDELFRKFLILEDEKRRQEQTEKKLKLEEEKEDCLLLNEQIYNSITNGLDNYKINFNDTQKLTVEHLPYYEFTNDFGVIQIPEIEIDKMTLLPDSELDFGKMKLVVSTLKNDKVELLVQNTSTIVDQNDNKLKKGMYLTLDLESELTLRLSKKGAMETWTLSMEKSTFEKELRNIDFNRVMNLIKEFESYRNLGNIEKYELQKSVMLFIDFVMRYKEEEKLEELYDILEKEPTAYEEYITKYNIEKALELKDSLGTYEEKQRFIKKLNFVNGLIEAKWLDYPRYIFKSHSYFYKDEFLESYLESLNETIKEKDLSTYLKKLFKEYDMFEGLSEEGKENLDKCLEYLSVLYKVHPDIGEDIKYNIEKSFMIGADEEEISLLISKLCRKGIKDYSIFTEYDQNMKEKYRVGELKYPIYSESFGLEEIRNGGEYDEF